MAVQVSPVLNELQAFTVRFVVPRLVDSIFYAMPTLNKLYQERESFSATDGFIQVPVMINTNPNAVSYLPSDPLPTQVAMTSLASVFPVAYYTVAISLPGTIVALNYGDFRQVINILKAEIINAEQSLRQLISQNVFSANNTGKGVYGLWVAIDDGNTYPSYGTLSSANYATWASVLINANSGPVNFQQASQAYIFGSIEKEFPNLAVGNYSAYAKLFNLLLPQQRFVTEGNWQVGPSTFAIGGAPFVLEPNESVTRIDFLNTRYLKLFVNENRDLSFDPFQKPVGADLYIARINLMCQLIALARRNHSAIINCNFAM